MCVSSSLLSASNPALPLPYKILHLGSLLFIQDNLPNSKFSTESHLLYIDLFFPFIGQHKFQRPGTDIFVGGGWGGIIQLTPPSNNSPPNQFWVLSINIRGPFCYYYSINGEGNGNLLQYSCLENSMDKGAWWATVHNIAELGMTEWLSMQALYKYHSYYSELYLNLFIYSSVRAKLIHYVWGKG